MEVEGQGRTTTGRLFASFCDASTEFLFCCFDPSPRGELSGGTVVLIQDATQRFAEVQEDYPLVGELIKVQRHVPRLDPWRQLVHVVGQVFS